MKIRKEIYISLKLDINLHVDIDSSYQNRIDISLKLDINLYARERDLNVKELFTFHLS